ncbi:hypothetical protein AB0M46_06325 [Dactylosporangium sp. NPDC051485]|uniref:hypothetical protein n=1 Tax=Dactylosporangium sp. NPDC051485 TaxID=3154846 RepID=UPI003439BE5C
MILGRGVRRLALAICALILGAGFTTTAPPSTVDLRPPVAISLATSAPAATVEERPAAAEIPTAVVAHPTPAPLTGRDVGATPGRAPPAPLV